MSDRSPQVDESKDEAARALFNQSHVMLYALSHGLSPHTVRQRLLDHVAGVPPVPRPKSPDDPYRNSPSGASPSTGPSPSNPASAPSGLYRTTGEVTTPPPPPLPTASPATFELPPSVPPRLPNDTPDPIVAYVRMPRSYRRRWTRS